MKIINIGDVHGTKNWKDFLIQYPDYDKVIFVGDYVDSFTISNIDIINNLLDIIEFKKANPDKVILLLGNHDIQYALSHPSSTLKYGCSGYRPDMHYDLYDIFHDNKSLFQAAYQYENYIWTHAGIHRGWYVTFLNEFSKIFPDFEGNIADKLNEAYTSELSTLFHVGYSRWGSNPIGGIFWSDKNETWTKPLKDYHQICGHTHINDIQISEHKKFNSSIAYIDVMTKPYIINI